MSFDAEDLQEEVSGVWLELDFCMPLNLEIEDAVLERRTIGDLVSGRARLDSAQTPGEARSA